MSDQLVRTEHVRALFQLLGEASELTAGIAARRCHVLGGVCRIVGARLAAMVEVSDFRPEGRGAVREAHIGGFLEDCDAEHVFAPVMQSGSFVEPALEQLVRVDSGGATARREDLVPDRAWYRSSFVMDHRRVARLDHGVYSFRPQARSGDASGMCINRAWGDRPFSQEERNFLRLFHDESARVCQPQDPIALLLRAAGERLSPRERATLERLLSGDAEKEIAARLELSVHTVHHYTKAIYRKLRVRSRGELMARAAKLKSGAWM